jgi:hypothetical protein
MLRLENDLLRIDVLPELGGKILHWVHKPHDRDWLWQNPHVGPAILPPGTPFDEYWCGGWDENFPGDTAEIHDGRLYPDHGELWTTAFDWDAQQSGDSITLHLSAAGRTTPTRMERWITLPAHSPAVRFRHRLTHVGKHGFDYLWKFHPALRVGPGCEIVVPAGRGRIAGPGLGRLSDTTLDFTWPRVPGRDGTEINMSRPPQQPTPGYEMVFLTELKAGWFAVIDHPMRCGFGMAFDTKVFNCLWLFQTFGGWRGHHVIVPEPATGYPYLLDDAKSAGRIARLEPGQLIETESAAVVFTGQDRVEHIAIDGTIS